MMMSTSPAAHPALPDSFPITIANALAWATQQLNAAPALRSVFIEPGAARREAELLCSHIAAVPRTTLIAWPERPLTSDCSAAFIHAIQRRCDGEPIAYLIGQRAFWTFVLTVSPATLIPRPETELLVSWALEHYPATAACHCVDAGTGSGAIALALALERPQWSVLAIEQSPAALAIAMHNAHQLHVNHIQFLCGNWLSALRPHTVDLIVANPPYIAADDPHLQCGDVRFEPITALVADADGFAAIDTLIAQSWQCLRPSGWCAIEHGWQQAAAVRQRFIHAGFITVTSWRDLAGIERITVGQRP